MKRITVLLTMLLVLAAFVSTSFAGGINFTADQLKQCIQNQKVDVPCLQKLILGEKGFDVKAKSGIEQVASLESNVSLTPKVSLENTWVWECVKPDGTLRWTDTYQNLVVEQGLTKILDATLKTGLASPAWYIGLVTGPSETGFVDGDTLASHAGWTEDSTSYTGNRPAWDPAADSITCTGSGSCSLVDAAKSVFTIDATCAAGCVISGGFMCSVNTGTSGTLLGVGAFSAGDRTVYEGDTLNIQVTVSAAKP